MISLFRSSVKSILPLLLLVLSTLPASADRFQYGDLWFETTSENTCEVTYFNNIWGEANYAFTEISIPELAVYNGQFYTVTTIGDYAFSHCLSLTSIVIPSRVTTIGDYAFGWCESLTSIDIPNSVTTIGDFAFSGCESLTNIDIPNSVTTIGNFAFCWCTNLTSVDLPCNVTTIGECTFDHCTSLTSIAIPSSVTTIGNSAFYSCRSLTSIAIPNSVMAIGDEVFEYCTSFTSIDIPSSVTTIGDHAFSFCWRLTSIDVDASNTAYASINGVLFNKDFTTIIAYPAGKAGSSYTIPSSVSMIGGSTFYYCLSLVSIDIPSSVTTIGDDAFLFCSNLTDIYNYALVPQAISYDVFDSYSSTLHVVKGYKDVYEAAEEWNRFNIVDDLEGAVIPFTFEQEEYHCAVGESFTPSVVGIDANLLEWTSSDSSILYIDPVYHLCLGRKDGVAYITAAQKGRPENSATVRVIVGDAATAIGSVTTGAPATSIYTLDGRRADHTAKGIGIVRTADGKTRKVMTK